jgi:tetratricopeptide (TPR) repeat protein
MGSRLEGAEAEAAYRKAIALLPGDATAYNDLAWFLAQSGRGAEALPMATKAAYLAPWDPNVLDTYAACLFLVGRCSDALRWERRAIDFIPEHFRNAVTLQPFTSALDHYERSCSSNDAAETGSP